VRAEILHLLAKGLTGDDVAAQLFISPLTVKAHVRNAMRELQAQTRVHAITIALQKGEIQL
jgi:DNA-binding CsgD family transcriptional regulator